MLGNTGSGTTDLLPLVLGLFDGLSALFLLLLNTKTDQSVLRLELAKSVLRVVNDAESSGLSSSELGAESEKNNEVGGGLVHGSDDFLKFGFGNVGTSRVDDVNDDYNGLCMPKPEYALEKAFLQDGDDYKAFLIVANDFGCVLHESP